MRAIAVVLLVTALAECSLAANFKLHSSVDLESCARRATHIVVAAEGNRVDGGLVVLESWKGDLVQGGPLDIPELASMRSSESREIHCMPDEFARCKDGDVQKYITGSRMILFLQCSVPGFRTNQNANEGSPLEWHGLGPEFYGTGLGPVTGSTIWIEGDMSFAIWDVDSQGKGTLARYWYSEKEIREKVVAVLQANDD